MITHTHTHASSSACAEIWLLSLSATWGSLGLLFESQSCIIITDLRSLSSPLLPPLLRNQRDYGLAVLDPHECPENEVWDWFQIWLFVCCCFDFALGLLSRGFVPCLLLVGFPFVWCLKWRKCLCVPLVTITAPPGVTTGNDHIHNLCGNRPTQTHREKKKFHWRHPRVFIWYLVMTNGDSVAALVPTSVMMILNLPWFHYKAR